MLGILDNSSSPKESQTPTHDAPINLPAFLDLADSAARLNSNLPDINARIEQKRQEHQQQRELQRRHFEEQMRALEAKQAEEEQALLLTPMVSLGDGLNEHIALSAPTTPPRNSFGLSDPASVVSGLPIFHQQSVLNDLVDYSKRSSVNYSVVANSESVTPGSHNHTAGAKSMPGSRRGSSGSHESAVNDMTASLLLGSLSLKDPHGPSQPPSRTPHRSQTGPVASNISAASLFDQDLDNEITNSLRHLPTQTEDERVNVRAHYARKLSVSSNALDLAPLQQSRPFSSRITDSVGLTSSEWPQFSGPPRPAEFSGLRLNTRSSSHNLAIGTDSPSTLSVPTPIVTQSPDVSRKSSPPTFSDASSLTGHTTLSSARSVPATPLTNLSNPTLRTDLGIVSTKTPGGPVSPSQPVERGTPGSSDVAHPTFSRVSPVNYDAVAYSSIRGDDLHNSYANDPLYLPNNTLDIPRYGYGAYASGRLSAGGADFSNVYHGSRNGNNGNNGNTGRFGGTDTKTNGLGGPKHRRGDVDREFNRFAGARLEDLQGDIPALCKDQHGCRYLQKKLEEDSSEHRDMIFRETFSHLSDLMTDPFGNYLCQKLLEFSTDEQRTLICEAVAQDLVQISLNMHGTRAVQKMIDFLSTQRQNDPRYEAQIRTIIVALSQHVVTLIKDLNGNHVVQKCLNRLAPEDNQFIYNAVAAHCVEVATHRHGCCVLQRCVDHALDAQRVQLVTEITYNALTLVQDPYGNYVVQYILDLNDNRFSDAVIRQFLGNVCALSVQKFSSNVIEKCIRVAEHTTRKMIIEELLNRNRLEKLLRDSFGNYCVQTALDYAEPGQRMILVEGIRPILPLIRNTPYGKRIQSKLQREHVETYGGYNHSNLSALSNGPRHHMPPSTTPHPRSVTDPYFRTSPYALAQNGAPSQLHPVPTMHNLQQHATDHAFSNHQVSGLGLSNQPPMSNGTLSNGFPGMTSGFGAQVGHNGFVSVASSPNDHYLQSQYSYAM